MQHFHKVFAKQNIRVAQAGRKLANLRLLNGRRTQHFVILKHFVHRPVGNDMPVRHYNYALEIAGDKFHVMRDDNDAFALAAKGVHDVHQAVYAMDILPGSGPKSKTK